jgi:hypothetical protein
MALVSCRSLRNAPACVLISMALIGIAQAFPSHKSDKKAQNVSMQEKTHEQVVSTLQSRDRQLATQAVHEIMKRGEPMILFLMHLKGDTRLFEGEDLGDIRSSKAVPLQVVKSKISQESIVTNEVAALYLISAIYYGNRLFASPWLADATLPRKERKPQNSSYLIAKAWEAVEKWTNELKKENLDSLRAKKFDPLKNSGVTFFD